MGEIIRKECAAMRTYGHGIDLETRGACRAHVRAGDRPRSKMCAVRTYGQWISKEEQRAACFDSLVDTLLSDNIERLE